jgi:hypothetical protein
MWSWNARSEREKEHLFDIGRAGDFMRRIFVFPVG